ncbi:MAG: hypothetical protein ACXABO_11480 [Promethearchaeota archaeon]|jgi:hypothetical protein
MKDKFSVEIQREIDEIILKIQKWKNLFNIKVEFYSDGWAIFLREKNIYPRCIVIFKSYENDLYTVKSFEIQLRNFKKEEYNELYSLENIKNKNNLIQEIKDIIYGKDLGTQALKICKNNF